MAQQLIAFIACGHYQLNYPDNKQQFKLDVAEPDGRYLNKPLPYLDGVRT